MSSSATPPALGPTGPIPPDGAMDTALQAEPRLNRAAAFPGNGLGVAVGDWDLMFDAVRARLVRSVGERPDERTAVPQLSASLVQAIVLDCVCALDKLHAALEQERSQRPTP